MYYDYLLTLRDEVQLFWGSNSRTSMSALFLVGRYLQLFGNAVIVVQNFGDLSSEVSISNLGNTPSQEETDVRRREL